MKALDRLAERARARNARLILPEGDEARIVAAARRLADARIAQPVLLGSEAEIAAAAAAAGVSLGRIACLDPGSADTLDALARGYVQGRRRLGVTAARRLLRRPLYFAAMTVRSGGADAMVAGAANPSRRVIEAALAAIGLAEGIATPSSFFLMIVPGRGCAPERRLLFADCALAVAPDAAALADIALASAQSAAALLDEPPRVALLSFSTDQSARHPRVTLVREAVALARARAPDLAIDGEFQADAALIPEVAARKVKRESAVAGAANVLVFPSLEAGNIAYKLVQWLAGARAVGPVLQGFARPVSDLSRGAAVNDVVATATLVCAQA